MVLAADVAGWGEIFSHGKNGTQCCHAAEWAVVPDGSHHRTWTHRTHLAWSWTRLSLISSFGLLLACTVDDGSEHRFAILSSSVAGWREIFSHGENGTQRCHAAEWAVVPEGSYHRTWMHLAWSWTRLSLMSSFDLLLAGPVDDGSEHGFAIPSSSNIPSDEYFFLDLLQFSLVLDFFSPYIFPFLKPSKWSSKTQTLFLV
jgi:hypothetical protein